MQPADYPMTLNAVQMMEILQCSREKLYEYARSQGFPRMRGIRHIKAPRDQFFRWYESLTRGEEPWTKTKAR